MSKSVLVFRHGEGRRKKITPQRIYPCGETSETKRKYVRRINASRALFHTIIGGNTPLLGTCCRRAIGCGNSYYRTAISQTDVRKVSWKCLVAPRNWKVSGNCRVGCSAPNRQIPWSRHRQHPSRSLPRCDTRLANGQPCGKVAVHALSCR